MDNTSLRTGTFASLLTAAAYLPGAHRSLSYDGAESVGYFVLAPSPLDALRLQRSYNNHPLFSFLENLVVQVAGHSDEWLLRLLPIAFGAAAVGVLVWAVQSAWGLLPALSAGLVLTTNPMFVEHTRSVRGYSLLVLATIISTLLLLRLLRADSPRLHLGYFLIVTMGMLTHLFMVAVLAAHAAEVLRRRALDRRFVLSWTGITALTLLFYARMLDVLLKAGEERGRIFRAAFPADLVRELLGHEPVALIALGILSVTGLLRLGRSSAIVSFGLTSLLVATTAWLVAPENLAPRFFLWLVPAVAVLVAATATSRPRLTFAAVVAAAGASVIGIAPGYTTSPNTYPEVAAIIDRAAATGATVCVSNLSVPPLLAYTRSFEAVVDPERIDRCDLLAVAEPELDQRYVEAARRQFPHRLDLAARDPAVVFAREPVMMPEE